MPRKPRGDFEGAWHHILNRGVAKTTVFRGRYTSVAIESDAHLVRVSRYVHLNPVEAGLAGSADGWAWSSAAAYFGRRPAPSWLTTATILDMFGPADGQLAYRDFLNSGVDAETSGFYARLTASGQGQTPRV